MRSRSKVRSDRIEHAASNEDSKPNSKRKKKDDNSDVGSEGDRSKRCKIQSSKNVVISSQSMATQFISPLMEQRLSCPEPERAADVSFASSPSKDNAAAADDDDDEMILEKFVGALRKRRAANRSELNATGEKSLASFKKAMAEDHGTKGSHDSPPMLKKPRVRKKKTLSDGSATSNATHGTKGSHNSPPMLKKPRIRKKKTLFDGSATSNATQGTLPQEKTEKQRRSHHKKGGHSIGGCLKESKQGEQDGPLPSAGKSLEKQLSRFGKRKCGPGNIKRLLKESNDSSTPTNISQKSSSSYSLRRVRGAKLRWKNLAWSIYNREGMRKKEHKQPRLVKLMKTWLTEAKFSQNVNDAGEDFVMTQDERYAFAQSMVRSCQANPKMRTVFLESVRVLAVNGVMQVAASKLLQQGPCDEALNVMNAWEQFKEQSISDKVFPTNLLNAVNELHEKRGDLSTKLPTLNASGICTMSQIDEQTWKFEVPR